MWTKKCKRFAVVDRVASVTETDTRKVFGEKKWSTSTRWRERKCQRKRETTDNNHMWNVIYSTTECDTFHLPFYLVFAWPFHRIWSDRTFRSLEIERSEKNVVAEQQCVKWHCMSISCIVVAVDGYVANRKRESWTKIAEANEKNAKKHFILIRFHGRNRLPFRFGRRHKKKNANNKQIDNTRDSNATAVTTVTVSECIDDNDNCKVQTKTKRKRLHCKLSETQESIKHMICFRLEWFVWMLNVVVALFCASALFRARKFASFASNTKSQTIEQIFENEMNGFEVTQSVHTSTFVFVASQSSGVALFTRREFLLLVFSAFVSLSKCEAAKSQNQMENTQSLCCTFLRRFRFSITSDVESSVVVRSCTIQTTSKSIIQLDLLSIIRPSRCNETTTERKKKCTEFLFDLWISTLKSVDHLIEWMKSDEAKIEKNVHEVERKSGIWFVWFACRATIACSLTLARKHDTSPKSSPNLKMITQSDLVGALCVRCMSNRRRCRRRSSFFYSHVCFFSVVRSVDDNRSFCLFYPWHSEWVQFAYSFFSTPSHSSMLQFCVAFFCGRRETWSSCFSRSHRWREMSSRRSRPTSCV